MDYRYPGSINTSSTLEANNQKKKKKKKKQNKTKQNQKTKQNKTKQKPPDITLFWTPFYPIVCFYDSVTSNLSSLLADNYHTTGFPKHAVHTSFRL